jgi:hypothetical protein
MKKKLVTKFMEIQHVHNRKQKFVEAIKSSSKSRCQCC